MEFKQTLKNLPKTPTKRILIIWLVAVFLCIFTNSIRVLVDEPRFVFYLFNVSFLFFLLVLILPYFLWVRWIANTAEKAGRSRKAFIWVGIFFPIIATIIVIIFKPATSGTPNLK